MVTRFLIGILAVGLIGTTPFAAQAADENMDSSVYLTFDPATGQFTSATKDLSATDQFIDTGVQSDQAATTSVAPEAIASTETAVAATPVQTSSVSTTEEGASQSSMIVIAGVLALLVFGGVGLLMRKGQSKAAV